jgi:membrane protein implicated in regulation of membrane protease activity
VSWRHWLNENRTLAIIQITLSVALSFGLGGFLLAIFKYLFGIPTFLSTPALLSASLFLLASGATAVAAVRYVPKLAVGRGSTSELAARLADSVARLDQTVRLLDEKVRPVVEGRRLSIDQLEKIDPELARERKEYSELAEQKRQHAREAERRQAIQEVISTLEHHQGDLKNWHSRSMQYSPKNQGQWGENRFTFAADPKYNAAYRATERAFQAIGRVDAEFVTVLSTSRTARREALEAIARALDEWNAVLQGPAEVGGSPTEAQQTPGNGQATTAA